MSHFGQQAGELSSQSEAGPGLAGAFKNRDELRDLAIFLLLEAFRCALEGSRTIQKGKRAGKREVRNLDKIFQWAVLTSYGQGAPYATFSSFEELAAFLGVPVNHLRTGLKRLRTMNVVHRLPTKDKRLVRVWVNPCPDSWSVTASVAPEIWNRRISDLAKLNREHPELALVNEPPPRRTLIEGMVEAALDGGAHQSQPGTASPTVGPEFGQEQSQLGTDLPTHINVEAKREFKRVSTLNALRGREDELLRRTQEFFARYLGRGKAEEEMAYNGPLWRKYAFFDPDLFERFLTPALASGAANSPHHPARPRPEKPAISHPSAPILQPNTANCPFGHFWSLGADPRRRTKPL